MTKVCGPRREGTARGIGVGLRATARTADMIRAAPKIDICDRRSPSRIMAAIVPKRPSALAMIAASVAEVCCCAMVLQDEGETGRGNTQQDQFGQAAISRVMSKAQGPSRRRGKHACTQKLRHCDQDRTPVADHGIAQNNEPYRVDQRRDETEDVSRGNRRPLASGHEKGSDEAAGDCTQMTGDGQSRWSSHATSGVRPLSW